MDPEEEVEIIDLTSEDEDKPEDDNKPESETLAQKKKPSAAQLNYIVID